MAPTVFSLTREGDPAPAVAAAVEALRAGRLCVLPTETGYGLAVGLEHAVRLRGLTGPAPETESALHVGDIDAACRHGALGPRALRLASQLWPGPLTLVVPRVGGDPAAATVGLRLPAHGVTQEILSRCGGAWMTGAGANDPPRWDAADAVASALGEDPDVILDDGPRPGGKGPTVLWAAGPVFRVLREGALPGEAVLSAAARQVLFVCTGNTCRSPLAAAMARRTVADALGIEPSDLLARGLRIASAGIAAADGEPASQGSLAAGAEIGIDLGAHRSRLLDPSDLLDAAMVYCLSRSHRDRIVAALPQFEAIIQLLDPSGRDIADPFGGDLEIYRVARDEIRAAVEARTAQIAALAEPG